MKLNQLSNDLLPSKSRKRVGRGIGSGKGKTCGNGHKGQKSRAGASVNGFEGGQMPIYRRVPKRGFVNIFRKTYQTLNVGDLQKFVNAGKFDEKSTVTKQLLLDKGIIKKPSSLLKILSKGELKAALKIEADAASVAAIAAVEKAGGSISVIDKKKSKKIETKTDSDSKKKTAPKKVSSPTSNSSEGKKKS